MKEYKRRGKGKCRILWYNRSLTEPRERRGRGKCGNLSWSMGYYWRKCKKKSL